VNQLFAEVGRVRDIVLVDQRGTGGSDPLRCPDRAVRAADVGAVTAYLGTCFATLQGDPKLQTTAVAADDLEALRRRLGYARVDVYGASYAATLAQAYAGRHPASVRTLVLDSGSLPAVRVYDRSALNAERSLDVLFARCLHSHPCHAAYPQPRRDLARLLVRPPVRVTVEAGTAELSADDVAWTIVAMLQSPSEAVTIPYAVHHALAGDYTALGRVFFANVGSSIEGRSRLAMVWEILCSEPWATWDPAATGRLGAGSFLAPAAVARARAFRRECAVVPRGRVASSVSTIAVPTLVLTGADDPLDPSPNMNGWHSAFPRGRLVVVANTGHGTIGDPCVQGIVARFVARGATRGLNASCAARVAALPFETG
jgi:pimeloyl-ACP methyl ester carboxylesterase